MKLSNDFSFFGLNTKAIRSYLKEQAKNQRGVRVTRRGDLVYVITSYAAFKLDVVLYSDVIQPVTLRECPTEGETIISGQCGFETEENAPDLVDLFKRHAPNEKPVERTPFLQDIPTGKKENAPDLVDLFKRHAPNEKPVERTPFLQDIPTGKKKSGLARLFHIGATPILINADYDSMVNPAQFTYYGTTHGYSPVYAVCTSDPTISVIMLPIKPTAEVEALCKKMFSE